MEKEQQNNTVDNTVDAEKEQNKMVPPTYKTKRVPPPTKILVFATVAGSLHARAEQHDLENTNRRGIDRWGNSEVIFGLRSGLPKVENRG